MPEEFEVEKVEFYWSLRGPIVLKDLKGSLPRERFAQWESAFTKYLGMTPSDKIAFRVIIKKFGTTERFSSVLVFSRDKVLIGQGVKNGVLVTRALGV